MASESKDGYSAASSAPEAAPDSVDVIAWQKPGTTFVVHADLKDCTNNGREFSRPLFARPPAAPEAVPTPFGWFYELDRKENPKAGPVYLGTNDEKSSRIVAADEGAEPFPLYAAPVAAPEAVRLTDEQIEEFAHPFLDDDGHWNHIAFARALLALAAISASC